MCRNAQVLFGCGGVGVVVVVDGGKVQVVCSECLGRVVCSCLALSRRRRSFGKRFSVKPHTYVPQGHLVPGDLTMSRFITIHHRAGSSCEPYSPIALLSW